MGMLGLGVGGGPYNELAKILWKPPSNEKRHGYFQKVRK